MGSSPGGYGRRKKTVPDGFSEPPAHFRKFNPFLNPHRSTLETLKIELAENNSMARKREGCSNRFLSYNPLKIASRCFHQLISLLKYEKTVTYIYQ